MSFSPDAARRSPNPRKRSHPHHHHNSSRGNFPSHRGRPRRHNNSFKRQKHSGNRRHLRNPAPPVSVCCICQSSNPKYKCPKCRTPYCSAACCKAHREKPSSDEDSCDKKRQQMEEQVTTLPPERMRSHRNHTSNVVLDDDDCEEGWYLSDDMKRALHASEWLRQALQPLSRTEQQQQVHPSMVGLRTLLQRVAKATSTTDDSGGALEDCMTQYPQLRIFLDKVKVVAGILLPEEEDLVDWLEYPHQDPKELGRLTLKPLPQRTQVSLPLLDNEDDDDDEVEKVRVNDNLESSDDESDESSSSSGSSGNDGSSADDDSSSNSSDSDS